MNRTVIRIVNAALLVLCCFLAGRVLATVAGETLAPDLPAPPPPPPRGSDSQPSWEDREVILTRNIFNVSTLAPTAAVPEPEPVEDYEETELPLRLLGTAAASRAPLSRAAVEDLDARELQVVGVGDAIQGAEVVRIDRGRVVLRNEGRLEELRIEEDGGASLRGAAAARRGRTRRTAARRPSRSERLTADVERLAENRYGLQREDVQQAAQNPAALFSQARILPKYEQGTMVGVQVNAIQSGSLFEAIGIQNGDTITEVNGIEVTGQQESAEVLRELTSASEFNVRVVGQDGAQRELQYVVQ